MLMLREKKEELEDRRKKTQRKGEACTLDWFYSGPSAFRETTHHHTKLNEFYNPMCFYELIQAVFAPYDYLYSLTQCPVSHPLSQGDPQKIVPRTGALNSHNRIVSSGGWEIQDYDVSRLGFRKNQLPGWHVILCLQYLKRKSQLFVFSEMCSMFFWNFRT